MQNDTFQLPDKKNEHPARPDLSKAEVDGQFFPMMEEAFPNGYGKSVQSTKHLSTNERLGHLGLNEGLERISRSDDNNEWLEASTDDERLLTGIGEMLEQERESFRNDYDRAA